MSGAWDHVAEGLQQWRKKDGDPSYGEIAARITAARMRGGASQAAAHVGRTTVYDVFRLGRTRINHELAREIATVLGAGPNEVEALLTAPPTRTGTSGPSGPSSPTGCLACIDRAPGARAGL